MPRGGEIRYFNEKEIAQIETMSGLGMPVPQIAAVLGSSKASFERRQGDQPEINEALLKGRARASAQVRKTAFAMATSGKHPALTIFWLKCREGWKECMDDANAAKVEAMKPKEIGDWELKTPGT